MKKLLVLAFCILSSAAVFAGNPDRVGQAGATELLINPWARSSGFFGMNTANVSGVEAIRQNVAGLSRLRGTEVILARTQWLVSSDVGINAAGFATKVGSGNAIGLSLMTMDFGDIPITTTEIPEGGIGTISPSFLNIGLSFSRAFVDQIIGGVTLRVISETLPDAKANGVALDAGIQYLAGPDDQPDQVKFGISLKNVGTPMRFSGDGLSFTGFSQNGVFDQTQAQRTDKYELPTQLNIGGTYDIRLTDRSRLTLLGNYTSNSFYKDFFGAGVEFGLTARGLEMFQVRAAYRYEEDLLSADNRTNVHTGLAAGFSLMYPFEIGGSAIAIDYAYRPSNPFDGSHTVGLRLDLAKKKVPNMEEDFEDFLSDDLPLDDEPKEETKKEDKKKDKKKSDAELEAERIKAEEEARLKAELEAEAAKAKAEAEATRKAEELARKRAEEEAKRKAEELAKKKAEEEAAEKAEAERKAKAKAEADELIERLAKTIQFETGSSTLKASSRTSLTEMTTFLKKYPKSKLSIAAHTDAQGTDATNMALSKSRAESVRNYFVSQGIDATRIKAEWFGESKPIADNGTAAGREKNRRVELGVDF